MDGKGIAPSITFCSKAAQHQETTYEQSTRTGKNTASTDKKSKQKTEHMAVVVVISVSPRL